MTILVVKASSVVAVGISKPKTKTVFASSTTIADGIPISLKNGWEAQYGSLATKIPSTGSWQIYLDIAIINGATGEQSMHLIARATNPVTP